METNKSAELGMVHISLPFRSMDDVKFSGAYAPFADELVDTLKDHLSKNQPDDDDTDETPTEPSMDQIRQGIPNVKPQ